jgi:phage terminase large subunit GpA-like protein
MPQPIAYHEYIHSDLWRIRCSEYKLKINNRCEHCGNMTFLQLHHIRYTNLGKEKDEDLIALCEKCHKKIHNINAD